MEGEVETEFDLEVEGELETDEDGDVLGEVDVMSFPTQYPSLSTTCTRVPEEFFTHNPSPVATIFFACIILFF